ncbi:multiple sugar transport system substrate-binding protein [Pseudochelatococcus lubricantis]|uniref:Multiple sugar transport system substrate-binding protein n=1 Tax=Pseudochelatococcus lubricantis TaxID=1538102 RepID=A0ABX0UXA2_9HYPH|nr:extracellular solute-binding protein [Pseudochelatococcus lubricantis]NIJ57574.1 multiple sugar transport system substrate-binding protein [Pseudochelatococcus lubricantis]
MFEISRRQFMAGVAVSAGAGVMKSAPARSADAAVEVSSPWGADKPFQKVVDAFNAKKLGVTVTNRFDGDYESAIAKAVASTAAGRPPAMMITGWKFGYFARRTLGVRDLRDIDPARAGAILANFRPSVLPLVTIDGAVIGLPWAMSTPITFINSSLWREAGLDPALPENPDTQWLYENARKLDAALKGKHPTYRSALALSNNEWTSQSFIQNAGGYIIDPDGKLALDSPEAVIGMTEYCAPAHEGLWIPVSGKEQDASFESGALAICTTSSTRAATFPFGHAKAVTAKFPGLAGHPRRLNSGGNFLAVYARNKEQAEASLAFLEFCASKEGQSIWAAVGYLNTSLHDVPLINDFMKPAAAQLADGLTAETIWPGKRGLEGQEVWRKWVSRMLLKEVTVPDGLKGAHQELDVLISG